MRRLLWIFAFAACSFTPAAAAGAKPEMGQSDPCGEAPSYVCVKEVTGQTVGTINSLHINIPANGAISVTLMATLECPEAPGSVTVQIVRDESARPANVGGAVRVTQNRDGLGGLPIPVIAYFPVKKGKATFYARYESFASGSGAACTINNGTMGYTYIPD